jgi:acyl carrier protein
MTEEAALRDQIRQVIAEQARLSVPIGKLTDDSDLFQAGLTSHASVNLMLALEEVFEIEFPEAMLRKSTFGSISTIEAALSELRSVPA